MSKPPISSYLLCERSIRLSNSTAVLDSSSTFLSSTPLRASDMRNEHIIYCFVQVLCLNVQFQHDPNPEVGHDALTRMLRNLPNLTVFEARLTFRYNEPEPYLSDFRKSLCESLPSLACRLESLLLYTTHLVSSKALKVFLRMLETRTSKTGDGFCTPLSDVYVMVYSKEVTCVEAEARSTIRSWGGAMSFANMKTNTWRTWDGAGAMSFVETNANALRDTSDDRFIAVSGRYELFEDAFNGPFLSPSVSLV